MFRITSSSLFVVLIWIFLSFILYFSPAPDDGLESENDLIRRPGTLQEFQLRRYRGSRNILIKLKGDPNQYRVPVDLNSGFKLKEFEKDISVGDRIILTIFPGPSDSQDTFVFGIKTPSNIYLEVPDIEEYVKSRTGFGKYFAVLWFALLVLGLLRTVYKKNSPSRSSV